MPVDIQLASRGTYGYCPIAVSGDVTIEGNGATLQVTPAPDVDGVAVHANARLVIRNLNFGPTPAPIPPEYSNSSCGFGFWPPFIQCPTVEHPVFINGGTLLLENVSIVDVDLGYGFLLTNYGDTTLLNSTIYHIVGGYVNVPLLPLGFSGTTLDVVHSTIADNSPSGVFYADSNPYKGKVRLANSIVISPNGPICSLPPDLDEFVSAGGNLIGDFSCKSNGQIDRAGFGVQPLDVGLHGGVVKTLALDTSSLAIGFGRPANCAATDARGVARNAATGCDAGAYEVGGGNGKLSATGMSGLYFNAANNGHYVSIQKLFGNQSLVIWNTFDEQGVPAWLYGVGKIAGNQIHVEQVAQNVGGTLHSGGGVTGSTPTLWGTLDVDLSDCYNASLSYDSLFPQFGSGSTVLQRLVFLDGVNCAR